MIPLRDDRPPRTFAFATIAIIIINTIVFWHELALGSPGRLDAFFASFALTPADLTHTPSPDTAWTVFTSMFLHGGWLHVLGNMWFLWIFGDNVEDLLGHAKFLLFYLLCGTAAALGQVLAGPYSTVPMVGASGAIAGVMGAYLIKF